MTPVSPWDLQTLSGWLHRIEDPPAAPLVELVGPQVDADRQAAEEQTP